MPTSRASTRPSARPPRPGARPGSPRQLPTKKQRRRGQTQLDRMLRPWWQTPWAMGGGALALIAVIVVIVVIVVAGGGGGAAVAGLLKPVPASVLSAVENPNPSVVAAVGGGGSQVSNNTSPPAAGELVRVSSGHSTLTSNGKPEIVFVGAEYCPYCAAERWAMVMALSRFGSFSGLETMVSSATDTFPDTYTMTFENAGYTSQYLTFSHTEMEDRNHNPLQPLTSQVSQIVQTYGVSPYQNNSQPGSVAFPFLDIANRFTLYQVQYSPGTLAGLTWQKIGKDLSNPQSPVTQAIAGSANYLTAALCLTTGNTPSGVCSSSTIQPLATKLSSEAAQ